MFVITGDIPAMWLRDSSAQVWPLLRLVHVEQVASALRQIVRTQWSFINLDPYANAFNASPSGAHGDQTDLPMHPQVWERKYEIDSLAFPVQLAHDLWRVTGDSGHLGANVHRGCRAIVDLWRREQRH